MQFTQPDGDTLWHKDPKRTGIKVIEMGLRGYTRKIALLDKYDTRLFSAGSAMWNGQLQSRAQIPRQGSL